jgi:glycosyltransferase involved in cell wall biosynthesis
MSQLRVSVLITAFNHEQFIARALEGAVEQRDVGPYEVLVGDDCSTDGTRTVIERYARRYPDLVQAVLPERNMGGAGKTLFAELLRRSRGRYVASLDGDDYWTSPGKLRRQVDYLDAHPECSMCFHNAWRRQDGADGPGVPYTPGDQSSRLVVDQLFEFNPVASCSPMFRREAIDPLPPWYFELPWGDLSLYFLAARHGELHYLPDLLGVYRSHDGGMYSAMSRLDRLESDVAFFGGLAGIVPPRTEAVRRRWLAIVLSRSAQEYLRLGERALARDRLERSFREWPLDPRRLRRGRGELRRIALWLLMRTPSRRSIGAGTAA